MRWEMFEEKRLIWKFNRGHAEALREIYERYKDELVTLAAALLSDKAEAEDVVHEVFVGLIRSAEKFRLTGSLKGFLATCVANRARNRNKSQKRFIRDYSESTTVPAVDSDQPDRSAMWGEELQHVGAALDLLPYDQREAVLLHLCSGMRFRSIADLQGVSLNTAQGRYRYGLGKLRTLLNGQLNR